MAKDVPVRQYYANWQVESFQDLIRSHRISKNLTQRSVAESIGAWIREGGENIVGEWENGVQYPSPENARALADLLEIPKDAFLYSLLESKSNWFRKKSFSVFNEFSTRKRKGEDRPDLHYRIGFESKVGFKMDMSSVGKFLKSVRVTHGLTMDECGASMIHTYSRGYIQRIETGGSPPSLNYIYDFCDKFGCCTPFKLFQKVIECKLKNYKRDYIRRFHGSSHNVQKG